MPDSPKKRYYWDSCVFLALINGEEGRVGHIKEFMHEAAQLQVAIYTSVLTIAEVGFSAAEKDSRDLDPKTLQAIDDLWLPGSPVTMVEIYAQIAVGARDLMRTAIETTVKRPKPGDAIHMATVKRLGVDACHTYNMKDFVPWASYMGTAVCEPIAPQGTLAV